MSESPRLVRFLVAVQRRPAIATVVAYAAILLAGLPMRWSRSDTAGTVYMTLATFAAATSAAVLSRATSLWARVAVVGLAVGATLPIAYVVFDGRLWLIVIVAVAGSCPHAMFAVVARTGFLRSPAAAWIAAIAAAALLAAAPAVPRDSIPVLFSAWLLALQLAFFAVIECSIRGVVLCVLATIVGCSGGAALVAIAEASSMRRFGAGIVLGLGGAWLVGALLAIAARIGASFTAIPADHPIVADLGTRRVR
jgi:hypothetical protein